MATDSIFNHTILISLLSLVHVTSWISGKDSLCLLWIKTYYYSYFAEIIYRNHNKEEKMEFVMVKYYNTGRAEGKSYKNIICIAVKNQISKWMKKKCIITCAKQNQQPGIFKVGTASMVFTKCDIWHQNVYDTLCSVWKYSNFPELLHQHYTAMIWICLNISTGPEMNVLHFFRTCYRNDIFKRLDTIKHKHKHVQTGTYFASGPRLGYPVLREPETATWDQAI